MIALPHARRLAFGVVLGQAGVTALAVLGAALVGGRLSALSALAGGGIATAGSLAMAVLVFGGAANRPPERVLGAFYAGEGVKVVVVATLFVVALKVMKVAPLAMFAAFAATFLVYWIALLGALRPRGRGAGERPSGNG